MSLPKDITLSTVHDTIRMGFNLIERRLNHLEADITVIRDHNQSVSTRLALIEQECSRRGKRCSELVRRVQGVENTGVIQITKMSITWRTLVIIATSVAAIIGIAFSAVQLFK